MSNVQLFSTNLLYNTAMIITLSKPSTLNILDQNGKMHVGGSQAWYVDNWRRKSGCGPVAASNLIWYATGGQGGISRYIELMNEMFTFITPGMLGIHNSAIFSDGIKSYGTEHGRQIISQVLDISLLTRKRPNPDMVSQFIRAALDSDAPVAFLNNSNGSLNNLESWHWVTVIAFNTDTMHAEASDYGKISKIDILRWLKTSLLGGTFVYFT